MAGVSIALEFGTGALELRCILVDRVLDLLDQSRNMALQFRNLRKQTDEVARPDAKNLRGGAGACGEFVRYMLRERGESQVTPRAEAGDGLFLPVGELKYGVHLTRFDQVNETGVCAPLVDDFTGVETLKHHRELKEDRRNDEQNQGQHNQRLREDEAQQKKRVQGQPSRDAQERNDCNQDLRDLEDVIDPFAPANSMNQRQFGHGSLHSRDQPFTMCPLGWHISQRMVPLRIRDDTCPDR